MPEIGKLLIIVGGFILVVGLVLFFGLRIPFLGRLPGDISVDRGNVHFYFPIVTCLLLSLVLDRKSTRLNSSHLVISYAVFCLKKKKLAGAHACDQP